MSKSPPMAAFFVRTRFPSPSIPAFCAPAARSSCICSRLRVALRFAQAPAGLTLPFGALGAGGEACRKTLLCKTSEPTAQAGEAGRPLEAGSLSRASAGGLREIFDPAKARGIRVSPRDAALRTFPKGFLAAGGDGCIIIDKRIMHRNRPSNEAQTASLKGRVALLSGFLRKRFLPFQQRAPAGKLNREREILHAPKAGERCGVIPTRQGRLISKQISLEICLLNSVLSSSWRTFFIIAQFSVSRQYRRPSCYRVFFAPGTVAPAIHPSCRHSCLLFQLCFQLPEAL